MDIYEKYKYSVKFTRAYFYNFVIGGVWFS